MGQKENQFTNEFKEAEAAFKEFYFEGLGLSNKKFITKDDIFQYKKECWNDTIEMIKSHENSIYYIDNKGYVHTEESLKEREYKYSHATVLNYELNLDCDKWDIRYYFVKEPTFKGFAEWLEDRQIKRIVTNYIILIKTKNMKKVKVDKVEIEGIIYVPENSIPNVAEKREGMPYVMVRTYSAGVHCGWLKSKKAKEVELLESIRIWKWEGAASLSQLAMEGTNNPNNCKFGMPITTSLILTESIEVIEMTETAKNSIQNVESWKQ